MPNQHEATHKARLVHNLRNEPGVRAQRFEDAFCVGLVDLFIGWNIFGSPKGGIWLEAKYHETTSGVLLPKSAITGNQLAWLEAWDGIPHPTAVILFTERGWVVCPTRYLMSHLCKDTGPNIKSLLRPYPVKSYRDILQSYEGFKQWVLHLPQPASIAS